MKLIYKRIITIITVFVILVVSSAYLIYSAYDRLNQQLVSRTSLLLGQAVEDALRNTTNKNLDQLTNSEKRRLRSLMNSMTTETGSIIHILLINTQMEILLSSDPSIEGQEYKSTEELSNILRNQPLVLDKTWQGGIKVLDVILPLMDDQEQILGYLRLVLSHSELANSYQDLSNLFIPIIVVFGLLLFLTVFLLSRAYKSPLESVKNMAAQLDKGDYTYRIKYSGNDEFTSTFQQLNKTIEKVGIMDESYKKAAKRISTLLKAVDESIVVLDQNMQVSSYNEAAYQFFQTPADIAFPKHFRKLFGENSELRSMILEAKKSTRGIQKRDLTLWLENGQERFTQLSLQLYQEDKQVTSYLLSFKDVASLQELQNNLNRSMKFGVIAGLASSISHEIKNPLSAMAIHAEILNTRISKLGLPDQAKVIKSLDVLQNEVKRLNRITNQFFNLARAKQPDLSLINLNSVVKDVLFLVQQQTIERNIDLDSDLNPNLDFIYGDPDQLKQVILNILLNAFQAIEKNGRVFVKTWQEHQRILVEIIDNGKGMNSEVKERLFEMYFTTKEDGGGIGLAVSQNILRAHEARISFESEENQGTRFVLDFPRKEKTTQINIPAYRQNPR